MTQVDIVSWNGINTDSYAPQASIYIKPTLKLLELFNRSPSHFLPILIEGTDSVYDNKIIQGIIDKSSDVPNCRDNFFNCTGLYVITLDHTWMGYPSKLGKMTIQNGVIDKVITDVLPNNISPESLGVFPEPTPSFKPKGVGFSTLFLTCLSVAILLILIVVLYKIYKV
jgi:hypothetical protein